MSATDHGELTGIVFHIIRGSFVDGHGVRTTVFLKGCPLRCSWCCNPEGQETGPELKVTEAKCNQCARCLSVCTPGALALGSPSAENKIEVDRQLCTDCGECIAVCYLGALEFFGRPMTVDEVYGIVERDKEYYRRSGGGVTIGGGEPTLQADFTAALMQRLQASGIHVALDTCGYTRSPKGLQILAEADLLLYDLKGVNQEEHVRNTRVSNMVILENLARLGEMGRPIIIRMPLIPGCNDSEENIVSAAEFLRRYKSVERIDLMPYHQYGTVKYRQLGKEYRLAGTQPLPQERVDRIKSIFESYGLKAQVGG